MHRPVVALVGWLVLVWVRGPGLTKAAGQEATGTVRHSVLSRCAGVAVSADCLSAPPTGRALQQYPYQGRVLELPF